MSVNMSSTATIIIIVAVIAVASIGAAAVMMNNGEDDGPIDNGGARLSYVGSTSDVISLYLSQKGSSERILLDGGGTFDIPPNDAIIIAVAINPSSDITIDKDSIMVERDDGIFKTTYKCTVAFGHTSSEDPVKIDSTSAYYSFTPKPGETVDLGLFVTNYYRCGSGPIRRRPIGSAMPFRRGRHHPKSPP